MIRDVRRDQYFSKFLSLLILVICTAAGGILSAATKSNGVGDKVIVSTDRGQIISQVNWNYGVTAMNDNGTYKIWWCGGLPDNRDNIWYATSTDPDGMQWVNNTLVMRPDPFALTCDPSVVKVGNTYYMYFTGTYYPQGINGAVYLATSSDGVVWTKYPNDSFPTAIIPNTALDGSYGIGQPSVLLVNGQFVMYYTDLTVIPGGLYRATSSDGIVFGTRTFIMGINDVDVKYDPTRNLYIMVRGGQANPGIAALHVSTDGFNWTPVDNSKYILVEPTPGNQLCAAPGLMGSPIGEIGSPSWAFCGHGSTQPSTWRIFKSDFSYFDALPNRMYRYHTYLTVPFNDHFYSLSPNSPDYYDYELTFPVLDAADPNASPFYRLVPFLRSFA